MDRKMKAEWVAALRSGQYDQARGKLEDKTGAKCCLGVLAEINGLLKGGVCGGLGVSGANPNELSISALDYFGMSDVEQGKCVTWNDEDNLTFCAIADLIEEKL